MMTSSGLVLLCSFWCHSSIMPPCPDVHTVSSQPFLDLFVLIRGGRCKGQGRVHAHLQKLLLASVTSFVRLSRYTLQSNLSSAKRNYLHQTLSPRALADRPRPAHACVLIGNIRAFSRSPASQSFRPFKRPTMPPFADCVSEDACMLNQTGLLPRPRPVHCSVRKQHAEDTKQLTLAPLLDWTVRISSRMRCPTSPWPPRPTATSAKRSMSRSPLPSSYSPANRPVSRPCKHM